MGTSAPGSGNGWRTVALPCAHGAWCRSCWRSRRARTRSCCGRSGRCPSNVLTRFGVLVRVCLRLVVRRLWFPCGSWSALLWRSVRCCLCAPVCVGPVPWLAAGWCLYHCAWSCACCGSRVVAGLLCCWVRTRGRLDQRVGAGVLALCFVCACGGFPFSRWFGLGCWVSLLSRSVPCVCLLLCSVSLVVASPVFLGPQ